MSENLNSYADNVLKEMIEDVEGGGGVTSVNGETGDVTITVPTTASDVGAIALPTSPASGDFLVYNGSAWVAVSMEEWEGGSY